MNERLQSLLLSMKDQGWDHVLVTDPKHVYYLTGFASDPHERFLGLLLSSANDPVLIVPALDANAAEAASTVKNIVTHQDTDNPYLLLKEQIQGTAGTLALEKDQLTVSRYEQLRQHVNADRIEDVGLALRDLRIRKSAEEVKIIKNAVRLVEEVLTQSLARVKIGVSELELVAELEYLMKKLGADAPSFATMVLSGPNTALPHGVPGARRIEAGDLLMFDLGVYAGGYASDITRTFAVGDLKPEAVNIYETVLAANLAGIQAVKPGVTYGSIDQAARNVIDGAGYGHAFVHRLGHGLGMDVHEYPSVHGLNQDILQPGAVFTIEPGIYLQGVGGVRIEDDVIVTGDGVEVLTSFPKELTVIG
ncbi:aminopeptidase P family protein [Paenibacillus sp. JNUCC32]|uniref:M24 family metallopeptidase n=1 Tax=Paenibacillus sp. JNUCC32 TaxID=2777984 RepID=UPI0017886C7A|nr:Xaa-Pro peptidase family protein [Paenibacillus sp. JNUCC-32]QOT10473.1 aminopeptidase P family protein [Paenibacillus sp. JNUCC-32]